MNYLRGAVSAISAPYQYYKELAPINPSTLTGAIDVIVVRVPDDKGGVDLYCSPFHVRFGKWQVLRPGDKKVSVSVNGRTIPFSMKIGEAGEAFFVFETEADVPEDLITSPILEATKIGETNTHIKAGKFGAKESTEEPDTFDLDAEPTKFANDPENKPTEGGDALNTENSQSQQSGQPEGSSLQEPVGPSNYLDVGKNFGKAVVQAVVETEREIQEHLMDRADAARYLATNARLARKSTGDDILPSLDSEAARPADVVYTDDVVIDYAGYHNRQSSERTITPEGDVANTPGTEPTPEASRTPTDGLVSFPSFGDSNHKSHLPYPAFRATSEPPPDHDAISSSTSDFPLATSSHSARRKHRPQRTEHLALSGTSNGESGRNDPTRLSVRPHSPPEAEYMWEWGAFPQRSPTVEKFAGHSSAAAAARWQQQDSLDFATLDDARGRSEPPQDHRETRNHMASDAGSILGIGAKLVRDKTDDERLGVQLEGQTWWFELALVDSAATNGRKNGERGVLGTMGELEAADAFSRGRVDYESLLSDDSIINDDRLVIRWEDRYITRADGSPLMSALTSWRSDAVANREAGLTSRPQSPPVTSYNALSDDEEFDADRPAIKRQPPRKTSSWARWWRGTSAASTSTDIEAGDSTFTRSRTVSASPAELRATASAPSILPPHASDDESTKSTKVESHHNKKYVKTLRLTSDQLKELDLKLGSNSITFSLSASGAVACTARIFVWEHTDHIVISDIDGTITKSDALGHVFTMIGRDWTHLGVAKLYTDICRNGYKIMYLTARAIGQADSTRDYLKGVKQNEYQLPEGPVIMSPDRLMASLHREVIMRKPEVFKMACLRDIRRLFGDSKNPFYAGFGNRITDALSYRSVDIPSSKIFTIDSTGDVKLELLELAGYKSSYIHMSDLVDQMFPPIHRKWEPEFTDTNFWKPPIVEYTLPDFTPASPALSARSDTSNQSTLLRLRNFSLMSRSTSPPPPAPRADLTPDMEVGAGASSYGKSSHLRQMSSFERVGYALGLSSPPRSTSPELSSTAFDSGSEDEGEDVNWQARQKRERRRSVASMPGSLPGSEDDIEFGAPDYGDEEDEEDEEGSDEGEHEEGPDLDHDETFDEDLLAAGEMAQVPFL